VTVRLSGVSFLWAVHIDHASILHRYGDMVPQILDARTGTERKMEEWKEKEEGEGKGREKQSGRGKGRERGRRKKWKGKGSGIREREGGRKIA